MFNFTTTHVVNSNFDFSTNKALWSLGKDKDENVCLHIKGVNNFKAPNVIKIYKAPYTEPKMAKVEIDLNNATGLKKGDTLRLSIYIRLTQADQSSYYANDTQFKGRPFTVEIPWLGNAADTLKNAVKVIRKYGLLVFEKELIKASINGTKLVLTAVTEFQRFHIVKLEKYVESENPFADVWEEIEGVTKIVEKGQEGFGTYGWVLRNIKLPTNANTQAFAPKQDEMPVPGAHYTQFTIHYCVNRGPLGLNAVGDTVKSVTTSVFYVNDALLTATGIDGAEGFDTTTDKAFATEVNLELALKKLADAAGANVWEVVEPNKGKATNPEP